MEQNETISVAADEGFYFGLGLFETIGVVDGRPVLERYHQERLFAGLEKLQIPLPSWAKIRAQMDAVFAAQPQGRYGIKVCVTAENCLVTQRPNHYTPADYEKGFHLEYSPVIRNSTSPLTGLKSLNYGDNILEKRRALRSGFQEPVFLNEKGFVTEGATTNLFGVISGVPVTPKATCGLLPGTVRRYLLEHCGAVEMELTPEMLWCCTELFVTNALLGIMPVTQLGGQRLKPGPVTEALRKQYQEECEIQSINFQV